MELMEKLNKKIKKNKPAFLLFEIMIVMILVALVSTFLLTGFNLFLKTGKKSLNYLTLTLYMEEKIWDLREKESKNISIADLLLEKEGPCSNPAYKWSIDWENTDYENIKKAKLKIYQDIGKNKKNSLNTVLFIYAKEEDKEPSKNNEKKLSE